mmetsp:Transcript_1995/g.4329  ORF Transcript_1995/g.4329 Transcript_1995/m.4329 type:complete len:249 (+) Transcript_1995:185-931(+)
MLTPNWRPRKKSRSGGSDAPVVAARNPSGGPSPSSPTATSYRRSGDRTRLKGRVSISAPFLTARTRPRRWRWASARERSSWKMSWPRRGPTAAATSAWRRTRPRRSSACRPWRHAAVEKKKTTVRTCACLSETPQISSGGPRWDILTGSCSRSPTRGLCTVWLTERCGDARTRDGGSFRFLPHAISGERSTWRTTRFPVWRVHFCLPRTFFRTSNGPRGYWRRKERTNAETGRDGKERTFRTAPCGCR